MKLTFVDVLHLLPVDATLRTFVSDTGLPLPEDFRWDDDTQTAQALVEAIRSWTDSAAQDRFIARLMAGVQLADAAGKQAMFQAAAKDGNALGGLASGQGDIHRSFWLYVHHPALFEQACEFDFLDRQGSKAQQHDLGVRRQPTMVDTSLAGLRQAISSFYKRELQCGDGCVAYFVERCPGVFLLTVHVKDLAMLRLEFEGISLKQRVGNPNIHMVLEYAAATGVVRTLVRGGAKYHQMMVDAFSEHLLGVKVEAERIRPPALNLTALRLGFDVPQAIADGFTALQVKSISVLSEDGALKAEYTAMAASDQRCVTRLVQQKLPGGNPLSQGWLVTAARINLYYPEIGKSKPKVMTVEVTSRGRLNLHKFDPALQAQLENYLVTAGILRPGQTLIAQEVSPESLADESQPVYES